MLELTDRWTIRDFFITSWRTLLLTVIVLAIVAAAWWHFRPHPAPVGETIPAEQASELVGASTQTIKPPTVKVYTKAAKTKLRLPGSVQDDAGQYVLTSSRVTADDHPHTLTTIIDEKTGEVQTFNRRDPLPWIAVENSGELRIDYGLKNGLTRVGRLSLRESLLQVKALHAGANASIDTDGAWFVGVGVGYKF